MYTAALALEMLQGHRFTLDLGGHVGELTEGTFIAVQDELAEFLAFDLQAHEDLAQKDSPAAAAFAAELERARSPEYLSVGSRLGAAVSGASITCGLCGAELVAVLTDPQTLRLVSRRHYCRSRIPGEAQAEPPCPSLEAGVGRGQTLIVQIEVPTGRLLLSNFFDHVEAAPPDKRASRQWSLNNLMGRYRRMQHKAAQGVAYACMGNLTSDVFAAKDGRRVALTSCLSVGVLDEIADLQRMGEPLPASLVEGEADLAELERNWTHAGSLCLDAWCWEGCDVSRLPTDFVRHPHRDYVELQVEPGRYELRHDYDECGREHLIASELRWVAPL